jgi:hydroxymethylbilane synthase
LATRGSPLALWQARRVASLLGRVGVDTTLVVVETEGDRRTEVPLDRIGGEGVFVKEVQRAVLGGTADAAVHSAKDLPSSAELSDPGLTLAAFPERADPRDTLVGGGLSTLSTGATVATGSARRRAQLANLRPDLAFVGLRGNLATRLGVVGTGGVAAVVVAQAALDRLDWSAGGIAVEVLEPDVVIPQVGQGALAVECRSDDVVTGRALAAVDDPAVRRLVEAERAFLDELGGGCTLPVGAHAVAHGAAVCLTGMLGSGDGRVVLRHRAVAEEPDEAGRRVARFLVDEAGGSDLGLWSDAPPAYREPDRAGPGRP